MSGNEQEFEAQEDYLSTRRSRVSTPESRRARAKALEHTASRVALARIDRQRRQLAIEEEMILSRPEEPIVDHQGTDDGPVVYFRKRFGNASIPDDKGYQYVAVRIAGTGRWHTSSHRLGSHGMLWEELLDFAAKEELEPPRIWIATDWEEAQPRG